MKIKDKKYKLILASKSPRRKELLEQIGLSFDILVSYEEEVIVEGSPEATVISLATQKANNVAKILDENSSDEGLIIIGADTVVALEGRILGKPKSKEDAYNMLKALAGKSHQVYTGVALLRIEKGQITTESFAKCTQVQVYNITDQEIWDYIETGEPMDKAGSYGIQGIGAKFIESIEGDYNNVVGLPIGEIYQRLNIR